MTNHAELAMNLFREGYNCSQAVVCAFQDITGLPDDISKMVSSSFGGGMGRMREICGAASAMLIVIGMVKGYTDMKDIDAKADLYSLVQKALRDFEIRLGSYRCSILLGKKGPDSPIPTPRTPDFYLTRPCERIIGTAAEIIDELILGT